MNKERPHYSNQAGHFERGQFHKAQRQIEKAFPDLHMRFVPTVPMLPNQEYIMRRFMRRVPRDGKR